MVAAYWPERVERITGVPAAQLVQAARMLGTAKSAMILTGRGVEQQRQGVNNVLACINIALALGQVGHPFGGYGCLTGQGNGQGGREVHVVHLRPHPMDQNHFSLKQWDSRGSHFQVNQVRRFRRQFRQPSTRRHGSLAWALPYKSTASHLVLRAVLLFLV
jgi:anaerobic selenocysteine-containing dehydrogenase